MSLCQKLLERIRVGLEHKTPFIVGITGPMGVGKSTFSENLKELLDENLKDRRVSIVRSDGFLYPNRVLVEKDLLGRKGFPETFDEKLYLEFVGALRRDEHILYAAPMYSQQKKDIDMEEQQYIERSDVYLVEGINLFFPLDKDPDFDLSSLYDEVVLLSMNTKDIDLQNSHRFDWALQQAKQTPTEYFKDLLKFSPKDIATYKRKLIKNIHEPFRKTYIDHHASRATFVFPIKHEDPFHGHLQCFSSVSKISE